MSTRGINVTYTYNYYFSILELPIIIWGLYKYRHSNVVRFLKIYVLLIILNLAYWFLSLDNVIVLNSYEMFLILITGFSAAAIIMDDENSFEDIETIMDWFTIFQFVLVMVSMVSGASGVNGRYAAIGMGSGQTANIAAHYLVWNFFARTGKTRIVPALTALVTIILTGSRTNLLAVLLIVVVFVGKFLKKQVDDGNGKKILLLTIMGMALMILMLVSNKGIKIESLNRVMDLTHGNILQNITTDDSYLGRLRSVEGSISILKKNPHGLPFSLYAIERESARAFSMEYPHSVLLSYLLLWSPVIAVGCLIYLVRILIRAIKLHDSVAIYMGFMVVMFILYGAPILYSKTYLAFFVFVSYAKAKLNYITENQVKIFERGYKE
ncbi:O-antigen ligase family protein [Blautia sp. MSJ-19]|nr:O-antigen ligase family protein [Blautia sp. MSJ-19]